MFVLPAVASILIAIFLGYLAYYMQPVIRNIVIIADGAILYTIINLHDITSVKVRLMLLAVSLVGILIGFVLARSLTRLQDKTAYVFIVTGLNTLLFVPVLYILLSNYLNAMHIEKMSIIFAKTLYLINLKLYGITAGFAAINLIIGVILHSFKIRFKGGAQTVFTTLFVLFLIGTLYLFSFKLNSTLYFYNNIIKETPQNLDNMQNLADHKGLIYISRTTLEQASPLTTKQRFFHKRLASGLTAAGFVGLIMLILLATRAKIKAA